MFSKIRYKFIEFYGFCYSKINSLLSKDIVVSIGDSLTKPNLYQALSFKRCKLINYGVGGSSLVNIGNGKSMIERFKAIDLNKSKIKFVTIMCSTNDHEYNVEIGNESSYNDNTFFGALNNMSNELIKIKAKVIFITPPQKVYKKTGNKNNELGYSISDYACAIKKICDKYKFELVDICNNSEIKDYNFDKYTIDKIHLNIKGHRVVANELKKVI